MEGIEGKLKSMGGVNGGECVVGSSVNRVLEEKESMVVEILEIGEEMMGDGVGRCRDKEGEEWV